MKTSPLRQIWVVFVKEVLDNLRDRRSVMSSLLTPLITPALLIAMIMILGRTLMTEEVERPLDLPVIGAENAPGLVAYLRENNIRLVDAPADPEAAVREGEVPVVLVIPPDYGEKLAVGEPAPLQLIADGTRQSSVRPIERARGVINSYGQTLAALRLYARGIDPILLSPLSVERVDVSTPQSRTVLFLSTMPFLLVMSIFVGGMYVIIDTTAGERERGSLEPLLINPVPRWVFVVGKLLASLPFGYAILALTLVLFGAGFNLIPLEEFTGMQMNIDVRSLMTIFWLSLPVVLLASVMQIVVASFTRSFKEAQTYLGFLPLVAGMPGIFLAFAEVPQALWVWLIPIFSQMEMINQVMRGEALQPNGVLISAVSTLVAAVLLTLLAIHLYRRETILFGGR